MAKGLVKTDDPEPFGTSFDCYLFFLESEKPITGLPMTSLKYNDVDLAPIPFASQPERVLYYEVLKRAVWDLETHIDMKTRSEVIEWFITGFEGLKDRHFIVSFAECIEVLDLGANEIEHLKRKVYAAEEHLIEEKIREPIKECRRKVQDSERQKGRITTSPLPSREWLPKCEEIPTVRRLFGNL